MENKQPCQLCGTITENLQHATISNGGLIQNKLVCQRCYGVVMLEQNEKPKNLLFS